MSFHILLHTDIQIMLGLIKNSNLISATSQLLAPKTVTTTNRQLLFGQPVFHLDFDGKIQIQVTLRIYQFAKCPVHKDKSIKSGA